MNSIIIKTIFYSLLESLIVINCMIKIDRLNQKLKKKKL